MKWITKYCYGSFVLHNGKKLMVHKVVFVADKNNKPRIQYTLEDGSIINEGEGLEPGLYNDEELRIGIRNF